MSRPLHALVVSVLVRDAEKRILLIKHPLRGWELPQGHVEHSEDLLVAAGREVFEESGYEIEIERLLGVFSKIEPAPSTLIFGFSARLAGGEATTSAESLEVVWFDEELAVEMVAHPVNRDRLLRMLAQKAGVGYVSYRMTPFSLIESYQI